MNEKWVRNPHIEEAYKQLHNVTVEVYRADPRPAGVNRVKLVNAANKKQAILNEYIKRGLTDRAVLEYDGNQFEFKSVYEAELTANVLMEVTDGKVHQG